MLRRLIPGAFFLFSACSPAAQSPESLWESGRRSAASGDCVRARSAFEALARLHPAGDWPAKAKAGIMDCPDYLPAEPGRTWVSGDSASGGKNMRQETRALPPEQGEAVLETKIWAGRKLYSSKVRRLRKADWKVEERGDQGEPTVLLRYPFREGESWSSQRGERRVSFRIEDAAAEVKVRGGRFKGCLKVREQLEGLPSWTYTYYAPGLGPVLTTVAGKGYENRSAELLSWSQGAP